jgi:hypothetical protein
MRVAPYLWSIAVLLTACTSGTTTTATSTVSPLPTSVSSSPSVTTTPTPTPTPSDEPLVVNVPDPSNLVAGYGSLWARSGSSLWQISPRGRVESRLNNVFPDKLGAVQNLAVGLGSVWTIQPRTVLRIDPSTGRAVARVETARGCDQIVAGAGALYLACRDSRLFRIDPDTNKATYVTTVGVSPIGIAYGNNWLWWINASEAGNVTRIDPSNGSGTQLSAPYARFVVPTDEHIWFIDPNGNAFSMHPGGGRATHPVKKARLALGAVSDHGTVLINDGDLVAFDADSGEVTQRAHVSGRQNFQAVAGIAVLGLNIWLVDPRGERIVAVPR